MTTLLPQIGEQICIEDVRDIICQTLTNTLNYEHLTDKLVNYLHMMMI